MSQLKFELNSVGVGSFGGEPVSISHSLLIQLDPIPPSNGLSRSFGAFLRTLEHGGMAVGRVCARVREASRGLWGDGYVNGIY